MDCFFDSGRAMLASKLAPQWRKPSGAGNCCKCCSTTSRSDRSTLALSNRRPNLASVGGTPAKRSGHSPLTVASNACTQISRRPSQRCALARLPCGGGLARSAATARLAAPSVTRTASSSSSNVPVTWAAKQSGKRLTVRPDCRQMNRRISAPRGFTRR